MSGSFVKTVHRVVLATVLLGTVAACSTPPEQIAAVPQSHGWVDAAMLPPGTNGDDVLISNGDEGN